MTNRYQKQVLLNNIGILGQDKLSKASVLVIGAGGLGVVVSSYLVAMGIGILGICDFDIVEESNLHRQFHFTSNDIGINKALVLSERLKKQNEECIINPIISSINQNSILKIAKEYQIICDCTDNAITRIVINDYCAISQKVLIHGAVSEWNGYITVLHHIKKYDLKDFLDLSDYLKSQNCSEIGIISTLCGVIGSYMANEAVKIILEMSTVMDGKILYVNMLNNKTQIINLKHK